MTLADRRHLGIPKSPGIGILIGVACLEALLVAFGVLLDQLLLSLSVGFALLFLLVSYRSPDLAWGLVWLAVPLSVEYVSQGFAVFIPTEPMLLLALYGWLLGQALAPSPLRLPRSLVLPLGALASVTLLSAVAGENPSVGIKAWLRSAVYVAFGLALFSTVDCDSARRRRWYTLIALTGAVAGLYGAARVIASGGAARVAYGAARPFFPEHGTYAAYLALVAPLVLLLFLDRRGWARAGYGLATIGIAAGLLFSYTRAAWVSIVCVVPLTLAVWVRWRRRLRPIALLLGGSVLIAAIALGTGAGTSLRKHAESILAFEGVSTLERWNRWMAAIEMIKDRPILGVGYGGYADAYRSYRRKVIVTPEVYLRMGPHSDPLGLLAETGILGFAAALWFIGAIGRVGVRVFRTTQHADVRIAALGILAGLATYLVHGLFNSYLGIDKVTVPIWLGVGALAGLSASLEPSRR